MNKIRMKKPNQNVHTYLVDFPQPDAHDRVTWICAICYVVAQALGRRPPTLTTVTIKQQKIPNGWVPVPVCDQHLDPPSEHRKAAVLLMFTEAKFKEKNGAPLTDEDFSDLLIFQSMEP